MKGVEASHERALRRIVADASTLRERLDGLYTPHESQQSARLAEARLEKWRERATEGDQVLFEQRLAWLGTTRQEVVSVLGDVQLNGEHPSWAQVFRTAMEAASHASGRTQPASLQPFGTILTPFVQTGLNLLAPACLSVFSKEILDHLALDLLRQLSFIAAPTLYLEFSTFRSARDIKEDASQAGTKLYDAFSAMLLEGGLRDFFNQYPVLARLLSVVVEDWAQNVSELAGRLEADLPDIRRVFGANGSIGRVVALIPALSDRHDGGRTVAELEFESGLKLIYKPRNLGIERAWFSLLTYLNERGGDFHILKVLDRKGYGWVEVAAHLPCLDAGEARNFYSRAGMLLCVLYAMGASDCFYENVVACGAYPVLIDMETLMHHVFRPRAELAPAEETTDDIMSGSVLRTGFLPVWEVVGPEGISFDVSGLGARGGYLTPYQQRRWLNVNTDAMLLEHEPIEVNAVSHLPQLNSVSLNAAEYAEEITGGFRQMYELLIELRGELLARNGPVENLGRQEVRVVFHATRIYGLLQKRLFAPRHMRSGVERSIEVDVLSRLYLRSTEKSSLWPMLEAEIADMERLDIPRFALAANSRSLRLPTGKVLEDAFAETALDRVRRRLSRLDRADMQLQIEFIHASLRISAIASVHQSSEEDRESWETLDTTPLTSDEMAAEAAALAALIEERAITSADGSAIWIAPQLMPQSSRYELRPLRMDMYGGLAGIALFFAALEHVSGTGRRTALAALLPLRRFISTADTGQLVSEGYTLGAATGVGSFIYALCRCAHLLDDSSLLKDAERAAQQITPEWIAADDQLDVTSGTAGAILGLLALHGATGNSSSLEKAVLCGDSLLGKREPSGRGAAWRSSNGSFMTGMAHGAAGMALACNRLYQASGLERFRRMAEEAIAFEDSMFDDREGNWPDFRHAGDGQSVFMNTWCHGAPGIGLARLSNLQIDDAPEIRRDIEAAVGVVARSGLGEKDGLCCGNLGRAELLCVASAIEADAGIERRAVQLASRVVARSRRSGGYRLSGRPGQDFFDPSFFQGLSGIGYQLLRIAHRGRLPCVLVWE